MAELGPVDGWPPAPIRTERLVLREPEARDRAVVIELIASPRCARTSVDHNLATSWSVWFRRSPDDAPASSSSISTGRWSAWSPSTDVTPSVRGTSRPEGGEAELGYLFLPSAWGRGYAAEACAAVLAWSDDALPGEPLVLCTQTANVGSMRLAERLGFAEVARFEEFGAEQWFGVRWP